MVGDAKVKIMIFGTGKVMNEFISIGGVCVNDIEAFVESSPKKKEVLGKKICSLESLNNIDSCDIFLVALKRPDDIYARCVEKGFDLKKVCLLYPLRYNGTFDVKNNLELLKKILDDSAYAKVSVNFGVIINDWIKSDEKIYSALNTRESMCVKDNYKYYIYDDKFNSAGEIGSYFWQDLWAAKKIAENRPKMHYDIGSRIDGFIAHLLTANVKVTLLDIRPLDVHIDGVNFICADATELSSIEDDSIESISALCSLEHFGLGRYGDPIDPEACYKCFNAIQRKVKTGGYIYISLPIGLEHLEFNAQRVFYAQTIINEFDKCELVEFSCANNQFEKDVPIKKYDEDINFGGIRFGLFCFRKR